MTRLLRESPRKDRRVEEGACGNWAEEERSDAEAFHLIAGGLSNRGA